MISRAIDEKLRRPVALKVLSARLLHDARHRETLLREARSAAAVNHPNIAAIHEVHEGPDGAFFVMELVEGETLRARLARTGPMPVAEALRVALDIARGLARAHAAAWCTGTSMCENVMLTREGHVKLLDFGLAMCRARTRRREATTSPTRAAGPPWPLRWRRRCRPRPLPRRAVGSRARPLRWRPSRLVASRSMRVPTSTASVWCSSRCFPERCRSRTGDESHGSGTTRGRRLGPRGERCAKQHRGCHVTSSSS